MSDSLIEVNGLHKTYRLGKVEVHALRGVDLSIKEGEFVAIMGPSGCGKTTMLNCLSGLDSPSEGNVLLEGTDLHAMKDNARTDHRAKHMGFIFQFYNLMPVLTAVENVEMPLLLTGIKPKPAREKALEMLDKVGLRDWANHKPAELSGGQRQRVTIARALVHDPAIIWADEPTGDLDDETSAEITELFSHLNSEYGFTFVMVTHDSGVAQKAKRLIKMHSGTIVQDISLNEK